MNFMETSSNSSVLKKVVVAKQTKKNMAQKRTIINIIDLTSTSPPRKSVALQSGPIQWWNAPNQNVDQPSNINIQNVMRFQNVSVPNSSMPIPAYSVDASSHGEKHKKCINFYTPGNFQDSSVATSQINTSAENVLSVGSCNNYVQSNVLISSSIGQHDFYDIPAIIAENNQNYVNQQWNLCGPFTVVPNTLSTFSSAPNSIINSSGEIQSNEFGIFGKENEQMINSVNIPALQPFTCYTETANTPLLLSQEIPPTSSGTPNVFLQNRDISWEMKPINPSMCVSEVPSTTSWGGFLQNKDISCKVETINPTMCASEVPSTTSGGGFLQNTDIDVNPITCASLKNLPYLFEMPNTSVELKGSRVQKEIANPKGITAICEIAKITPNRGQTVISPLNKQKEILLDSNQAYEKTQRLVQEEHSYSTMTLDFLEDLRDVQKITETEQLENRRSEFNIPEFSKENETVTNSKPAWITPIVNNDNELDDEFINCLYGEFDINDKGDIEFPEQNALGSLKNCSEPLQGYREFQIKREREENKNKVGVVLKKMKRGYESSLL